MDIDHTLNQFYGFFDTVACTVDTKIIVYGIAPFTSGIKMIVLLMSFINPFQTADGFLEWKIVYLHHTAHTLFKRSGDEDTDVRDTVVCQNHIRTAAHYDKVFFFCHFHDQIALVEKYGIFLRAGRDNG